jgi:hypothetical protein
MGDVEKVTKEAIANGGILAMLYFDLHAKTKEMVQDLGAGFVNSLIQKDGVIYALGEIDEPIGGEEGKNWSSSVEVKILTKDFATLAGICMANSPFNAEILRPDEVRLSLAQSHELLATIAAASAEYKRYILTKLASPEEKEQVQQNLKRRADMGKDILSRKKER